MRFLIVLTFLVSTTLQAGAIHKWVDADGNVWPPEAPGIGLEVNEDFLARHPAIEGPGYV